MLNIVIPRTIFSLKTTTSQYSYQICKWSFSHSLSYQMGVRYLLFIGCSINAAFHMIAQYGLPFVQRSNFVEY